MERPGTCASGRRLNDRICEATPVGAVTNGSVMGGAELRGGHAERRCARAVDAAALAARFLHCEAVRWVESGFRVRRTDTLFRPVPGDSRKRRGNVSSIRRAPPRAALSSEAVRVGPYKGRACARGSTSARDCACVRTCARPTQSQTTPARRQRHRAANVPTPGDRESKPVRRTVAASAGPMPGCGVDSSQLFVDRVAKCLRGLE